MTYVSVSSCACTAVLSRCHHSLNYEGQASGLLTAWLMLGSLAAQNTSCTSPNALGAVHCSLRPSNILSSRAACSLPLPTLTQLISAITGSVTQPPATGAAVQACPAAMCRRMVRSGLSTQLASQEALWSCHSMISELPAWQSTLCKGLLWALAPSRSASPPPRITWATKMLTRVSPPSLLARLTVHL